MQGYPYIECLCIVLYCFVLYCETSWIYIWFVVRGWNEQIIILHELNVIELGTNNGVAIDLVHRSV